jgi:hypothetical protein
LKKSFAVLLAMLSFAVSLRAGACVAFCVLPNCHAQTAARSSHAVTPCPHESSGAPQLGSKSGCNPAFACSCFSEQPGQLRATHQIVLFAPYVALVQPSRWEFSEGAVRWRILTRFSHALITASPTILRI